MHCKGYIVILLFTVILASCSLGKNDDNSKPVAEVDGVVITTNMLKKIVPDNLDDQDSVAFIQNYVSKWVRNQLLLRKAELNLTEKEKDVSQLLEDYRTSLLIHKYRQKLLKQKYAPVVTQEEINNYYTDKKENFILDKNIILGYYIKLPINTPNYKKIEKLFNSKKEEDFKELENYCYQNAQTYNNFLDKWNSQSDISSLLPKPMPTNQAFFRYNNHYKDKDSLSHYFVFIEEYALKGQIAPQKYVEDRIKAILLNKKRIEYIRNIDNELYSEGLEKKTIKFY